MSEVVSSNLDADVLVRQTVDWDQYAHCYDLLCSLNPAYLELLREFRAFLEAAEMPEHARVLDLGGGTGNFFCLGLPQAVARSGDLIHLDFDTEMLRIAKEKYAKLGLNVTLLHKDASKAVFPVASLDCVVSVNALYAMPEPTSILSRIFHWLRPGGRLFVVNLGRIQNTTEWTSFLIRSNARKLGLFRTLRILLDQGLVISRENRKIARAQRAGVYWKHDTEEFRQILSDIGFEIDFVRPTYRGYSDIACCRKPLLTVRDEAGQHSAT